MKNIYFIIILSLNLSFTQEAHWATTRFETFWKKTFKQMSYREPITFLPYNIKISYYQYGGKNYWDQFKNLLSSGEQLQSNPFNIPDDFSPAGDFPDISDSKYRRLIGLELDLLRYNFFLEQQNKVDIQIGIGYKIMKNINKSFFENGDQFSPEFKELNINSTFIIQWAPSFYNYLYYSVGYNTATLYTSSVSKKEATGSGLGQGLGLGLNFIIPNKKRTNDLHCGVEIKFSKCKINKIKEPDGYNRIDSFNMEAIGVKFSFGIGYGGKKTLADEAYVNMVKRDYLLASEQFQSYKNNNKIIYNSSNLDRMINFCYLQIPYQQYSVALEMYYNNELESAAERLKKINYSNDVDLEYKVESSKYIIADRILNNFIFIEDEYSINYQIQYYKSISDISYKIKDKVNQRLSNIYLNKGDLLLNNGNYEEAYEYYMYANTTQSNNPEQIKIKMDNLITIILNDVYKLLQNKENVIAYEKLSFAKDISSANNNVDFLMEFIKNRISALQADNIRERMLNIINNKRQFVTSTAKKDIYLGDNYENITNVLGFPLEIVERKKLDNLYEMMIYNINNIRFKLFFKNKILIDIDK